MEMKMWVGMVVMVCLFNIHIECKSILDNAQDAQLLCYFIFGDSLADNGNNNNLETKAKVDYFPYGIDYSDGHIGRFTNGRTIVDIIAELLGFKHHIPAFAATFNTSVDILTGVNYASGSAGILEETGKHLGTNIDLDRQLENHKIIVDGITELLKNQNLSPAMYLNKCLYSVGMGNNDYLNNYFMPKLYSTSYHFTPDQYATILVDQYSQQLRRLYNYGARKVAVFALGKIGCIPFSLATHDTKGSFCVDEMNSAAELFNKRLKLLVDQLNRDLVDAKFSFLNPDPPIDGFTVFAKGCCEVSEIGQCIPWQIPCSNREEYVFWDSFHPTEAMNRLMANLSYNVITASYALSSK